ncbi:hypothetical protein AbraIFM66951_010162 [Aspergillus brasiliensis]|nr:hypothetical protein AbraIFM66951_010162 [Aspergillus brasiliensis]
MATGGGINFVRFYFYQGFLLPPERQKALVALAYSTARDQKLAPKAILIRSDIHDTTSINGQRVKDPNGWHVTMAFKDNDQVERLFHVTSHGYTNGKEDFVLKKATHDPEKVDSTPRGGRKSGKVVWPAEEFLEEYVDSPIGYSHLPEQN